MTQPNQHTPTTPLAFVIPVVHPGGHRVSNYDVVEKSLRLTLTSLTQSSLAHAPIFIVCHKRPDWHAEFAPTVTFLVIPEHPWFTDDVKDRFSAVEGDPRGVRIDKGLKFLAGMAYARRACDPRFLMPMDADDFVRKDIIKHINRTPPKVTRNQTVTLSHVGSTCHSVTRITGSNCKRLSNLTDLTKHVERREFFTANGFLIS